MSGTEAFCLREAGLLQVDRDDLPRAAQARALNYIQAYSTASDHGDRTLCGNLCHVHRRAESGHYAASNNTR